MKCFVAIDEDLLMQIWMLDPTLVVPFSRASVSHAKACAETDSERPPPNLPLHKGEGLETNKPSNF